MALETEGLIVASSEVIALLLVLVDYPLKRSGCQMDEVEVQQVRQTYRKRGNVSWNSVGILPLGSFAEISGLQVDSVKSIAGYPGGCDGGGNGLQLRSFKGLNLALGSTQETPILWMAI